MQAATSGASDSHPWSFQANFRLQAESSPSNSNHSHGSAFYSSSPFRSSKYHDDQPSPRRQPVRLRRFYDPIPSRESDYTFTKKGSSRRSTLVNNNGSQGLVKRFITQVRDRLSAAVDGKKPHRMVVTHIEKPRSDSYYRHAHKNGWMKYSKWVFRIDCILKMPMHALQCDELQKRTSSKDKTRKHKNSRKSRICSEIASKSMYKSGVLTYQAFPCSSQNNLLS